MLEEAARRYAADPATVDPGAGCLVIEGARCSDPEVRNAARTLTAAAEGRIRQFVAGTHPEMAGRLTNHVVTVMTGLSTMAREGYGLDRLLTTARLAGQGIALAISARAAPGS